MGTALPRLHVLTDMHLQVRHTHLSLALTAASAGPCAVQLREKAWNEALHGPMLRQMLQQLRPQVHPVIVNDHLNLALRYGAAGVHLGQGDAAPAEAVGRLPVVGATVHSRAELEALSGLDLQYIGVGPIYGTRSKALPLPPLGLNGLRELCNLSPYPVIAIGSLTAADVAPVLEQGAYGVAVLSAFVLATEPQRAVEDFLSAFRALGME